MMTDLEKANVKLTLLNLLMRDFARVQHKTAEQLAAEVNTVYHEFLKSE